MADEFTAEHGTTILVSDRGGVRRLTLNRPEKLNAMDAPMEQAFLAEVEAAMEDSAVSVLVIAGAGRAFCAGADMRPSSEVGSDDTTREADGQHLHNASLDMVTNRARVEAWLRLWSAPKPIIAQVHGYSIGIANEIVGASDLIVCGESAKFGMPEVREMGLPPTLGFWPARIGVALTKDLLFTGRWMSGGEAAERGLASRVVPDDDLVDVVDELAAHIAAVPAERLAVVKQAVNAWSEEAGVRTAALRGADYHALYHQATSWIDAQRSDGIVHSAQRDTPENGDRVEFD